MGEDQHRRAGRGLAGTGDQRVLAVGGHAGDVGEFGAAVEPGEVEGQAGQHARDGAADMAGTEQGQWPARAVVGLDEAEAGGRERAAAGEGLSMHGQFGARPAVLVGGGHALDMAIAQGRADCSALHQRGDPADVGEMFDQQPDAAAAALAEQGAERIVLHAPAARRQSEDRAALLRRAPFERPAADRARLGLGCDEHAGAGAAWRGAFGGEHGDERGRGGRAGGVGGPVAHSRDSRVSNKWRAIFPVVPPPAGNSARNFDKFRCPTEM